MKAKAAKTWNSVVAKRLQKRGRKENTASSLPADKDRPRFSLFLASFRR